MASYEQQAEVLSRLNAFSHRNRTNFNKTDALIHEIHRHRENQTASIKFRNRRVRNSEKKKSKNEYDRLRGAMLAGLVRESFKKYINERMGKLKDLARQSIHGKKHDIFSPKEDNEKTDEERLKEVNRKLARNQAGRVNNTLIVTPAGATPAVYT